MTLYLTADLATHYPIEAFGVSAIGRGNFTAGQVVTNKAMGVGSDEPIVVNSYIRRRAASGAIHCLSTSVLGKRIIFQPILSRSPMKPITIIN
ncbi:MAG: hypothetical protein ACXVMS_02465 [Flavisolibacter sp.]